MMIDHLRRLLLISNSTLYGRGHLDHAESEIVDLVDGGKRVLFIPFAMNDRRAYAAKAEARFRAMGLSLRSAHDIEIPESEPGGRCLPWPCHRCLHGGIRAG